MAFLRTLRRWVGVRIAGVRNAAADWPTAFRTWFWPTNIFANRNATTLASSETIFAAVSKLSNSLGTLPVGLFDGEHRRQTNSAIELLTYGPNPNMHRVGFMTFLEALRNSAGNGYALKSYDTRAQVDGFHPLDPTRVEPVIEAVSRELWYRIDGDKGRYYVHNRDMLHVKHISTTGGLSGISYKGISPLDVLAGTIDFDAKVRTFSLDQIESSVRASFVLTLGTMLDTGMNEDGSIKADSNLKRALDAFKAFYAENGGVLLEHAGMKIREIEQKFLDTKVFDVEKITNARVAKVFGLPDPDATGYNSREQEALRYVTETIMPIAVQYEAEFDRKLLTPAERSRGLHFKLNITALLRADMTTRMDFYFKGIRTGAFTPNQVCAWEELPPYEGEEAAAGLKHYMSRDISPVGAKTESIPR